MSYRPITDMWILARAKLKDGKKLYGAYPGGFLERARALVGAAIDEPVLHVCGGMVRHYPYKGGFGLNDRTLDLDEACTPDFLMDARAPWPTGYQTAYNPLTFPWKAILIDPPYSDADAAHYPPGPDFLPQPGVLLQRAWEALEPGRRVGILHYLVPRPPANARFVAVVGVMVGYNNRLRAFSVFEKTQEAAP